LTATARTEHFPFRAIPVFISAATTCIFLTLNTRAVELENWRFPYYLFASHLDACASSPSTMFWDDIGKAGVFSPVLWPDSGTYAANHWTLEPSLTGGIDAPANDHQRLQMFHTELLNDIRYKHILARQTLDVDSRYDYDPFYPAHPDRFVRGRIEEAYLQVDFPHGFARLGRLKRNWGPYPDHSFLLSSNPYTYDAFEWQLTASIFEFRQFLTMFPANSHSNFDSLDDNKSGRYFAAHALNVMFGKWVTAGIFESMVFYRGNSFPDIQYLNPFDIYTVTNTNQEGQGNLMLGLQWRIHPFIEKINLAGQLALDDFQVDRTAITDKEPPHWGIDMTAGWRDPVPLPVTYSIELLYRRASEWLYTVTDNDADNGERYTYLGKGLGFWRNDFDKTGGGIYVVGKRPWCASLELSYSRNGANTVLSRWRDNIPGNTPGLPYDYQSTAFPSGIVEQVWDCTIGAGGYFKNYADLQAAVSSRWVRNKGNITSSSFVFDPRFSCALSVHYCDFFYHLPQ
jgi:hypothetical protein